MEESLDFPVFSDDIQQLDKRHHVVFDCFHCFIIATGGSAVGGKVNHTVDVVLDKSL